MTTNVPRAWVLVKKQLRRRVVTSYGKTQHLQGKSTISFVRSFTKVNISQPPIGFKNQIVFDNIVVYIFFIGQSLIFQKFRQIRSRILQKKKEAILTFFHSGHQFQKARTYVFPFAVVVTFRVEGKL